MANTLELIERIAECIDRSDKDKGWKLPLEVIAYDNGMININGVPAGTPQADRWLSAARMVLELMERLQQRAAKHDKAA
jgi:hypothetical protein